MGPEYPYKIRLEAEIIPKKASVATRKEAASVLGLPPEEERQADLTYFTSIFVSSGENLNRAFFLPSEMVMADKSIPTKAVDIEHEEDKIIGHIYKHAYIDDDHNELAYDDLVVMNIDELEDTPIHIEIASVVYKTRFPEIASEIEEKKWKVSMEAYYRDFDIKVGDMVFSKTEAAVLGLDVENDETFFSTIVQVVEEGGVVAEGYPARVLRGIHFSGVGIVENPANPPSVILETSGDKNVVVLDRAKLNKEGSNNVTTLNIEGLSSSANTDGNPEADNNLDNSGGNDAAGMNYNDSVGICVSYKKELLSTDPNKDQDSEVIRSNWCTAFNSSCTAFGHDATDANCLRQQAKVIAGVVASVYEPPVTKKGRRLKELIDRIDNICKK